jgi:hypothetical protein
MHRLFVLSVLFGASTTSLWGQTPASTHRQLQSGLEAAQAGAIRPGDESLSCEALGAELVASVRQPAVQSYVTKWGAVAQERMAAMNAAAPGMAAQSALAVFSALVPGGAWAGHAGGVAQAQAQQAQAASNMQQAMQQAQETMAILPHMMRGQRVIELAQARTCPWLQAASPR